MNEEKPWIQTIKQIMFGYQYIAKDGSSSTFEMIYGISPKIFNEEHRMFIAVPLDADFQDLDLLASQSPRARRVLQCFNLQNKVAAEKIATFVE